MQARSNSPMNSEPPVHLDAADGIGAPLADEPPQEVGGASGVGPGVHPAAEAAVAGSDGVEALERDAIPAERHVVDLDGRVPVPAACPIGAHGCR